MPQDPEVVILDEKGVEHVFPAGFDPKRAAGIVKQQSAPVAAEPSLMDRSRAFAAKADDVQHDLAMGVVKGAGSTVAGLGRMVQTIPGVTRAVDALYGTPGISQQAMRVADEQLKPSNTTQTVGKVGEQVAETLIPAGAIERAGATVASKVAPKLAPYIGATAARLLPTAAVEGAASAGMADAQGGSPLVGGVLGVAAPVASAAMGAVAPGLREAAGKQVEQALGATKEHYKALGARLVPEILRRGIRGSREAIAEQAGTAAENAGQAIDTALQQYGARQVGVQPVVAAIETAKDAFRTTNAAGKVVVFEPRAVSQLDDLQKVVKDLGPDARVDQLVALRRTWDQVVADAGGFSHRAPGGIGRPLADISEAANKREATTAIRQLLNQEVPELTALNKEYSFWKNLDDVVTQTLQRKQPQAASLTGAVKEAAGAAAGAAVGGGVTGAIALGKLSKFANTVFTSPRWQLASAQAKDALADAIVSGSATRVAMQLSRIAAVQGSKVPAMAAGQ